MTSNSQKQLNRQLGAQLSFLQSQASSNKTPKFEDHEIPVDLGDHQNFTLVNSPNPSASLILTLNGQVQQQGEGNDYTLSGNAITFFSPLTDPVILLAWYRH